jgi:hypothetical protein
MFLLVVVGVCGSFPQTLWVNPFLALFFRWSHERLVFTNVDKACLLYAGILASFLVRGGWGGVANSGD